MSYDNQERDFNIALQMDDDGYGHSPELTPEPIPKDRAVILREIAETNNGLLVIEAFDEIRKASKFNRRDSGSAMVRKLYAVNDIVQSALYRIEFKEQKDE